MVGQRLKLRGMTLARLKARSHTITRARQRFSLTLSFDQVKEIEREILLDRWPCQARQGARGLYLVRRAGSEFPLIYDHFLGAAITVLGDASWFARPRGL